MKEKTLSEKFSIFKSSMNDVFANDKLLSQQLTAIKDKFTQPTKQQTLIESSSTTETLQQSSSLIESLYSNNDLIDSQDNPFDSIYTSQFQPNSPSIVFMALVAFNHKKGSVIESTYPNDTIILQNPFIASLNPNETPKDIFNNITSQILHNCLPEGIHLSDKSKTFFLVRNQKMPLYGISSYRQINTDNNNIIEDEQENTRDCIQKALCVISTLPLFKYLSQRVSSAMDLFFAQRSLKDKRVLVNLYDKLSNQLYCKFDSLRLMKTFDSYSVIVFCREKIFMLMKMVLLEKRIVIYSATPEYVCGFIFALLSLCNPGGTIFNMNENERNQGFDELGLPLKLFHKKYTFYPLFTLSNIDDCKPNKDMNFLIGTTNTLVLKNKDLNIDCTINLDEETIDIAKNINEKEIELSSKEKKLYKKLEKELGLEENDKERKKKENKKDALNTKESLFSNVNWFRSETDSNIIDNTILPYFFNLFYDLGLVIELFRNDNYDIKTLILNEKLDFSFFKDKNKITHKSKVERCIRKVLHKYNILFITQWIKTDNFNQWYLNISPSHLAFQSKYYKHVKHIKVNYFNKDWYNGPIKQGMRNGKGSYHFNDIDQLYLGEWVNNKRSGNGNQSNINNTFLYEGEWLDNEMHGFGCLISSDVKYTGFFNKGLFHGEGNWINQSGDVYEGTFKNGLKDGLGKLYNKAGLSYDGFFENDQYEGQGVLTSKDKIKYQGTFNQGKLNGEATVITPDGKSYKIVFKDNIPINNKAMLLDEEGNLTEVDWPINNNK